MGITTHVQVAVLRNATSSFDSSTAHTYTYNNSLHYTQGLRHPSTHRATERVQEQTVDQPAHTFTLSAWNNKLLQKACTYICVRMHEFEPQMCTVHKFQCAFVRKCVNICCLEKAHGSIWKYFKAPCYSVLSRNCYTWVWQGKHISTYRINTNYHF